MIDTVMRLKRGIFAIVAVAVVAGLWACPAALGAMGPQNVAVVVNADSWASMTVANEYIHLRNIPPKNVIYLHLNHLKDFEIINVEQFRRYILKPVIETLERRGVLTQIDCVSYSSDIPYGINVKTDIAGEKVHAFITPVASINGLTFLYPLVLKKNINYLDPDMRRFVNWYFRVAAPISSEQNMTPADVQELARAGKFFKGKKWAEAETVLSALAEKNPRRFQMHYNLARCQAQAGRREAAMDSLRRAVENGWWDWLTTRNDNLLKPLRGEAEFAGLLTKMRANPARFNIQPSIGFSYRYMARTRTPDGSVRRMMRLMPSTMLAVTSGRGNSVSEAIDMLRMSAAADATKPKGTVYYAVNDDPRSRTRQWGFIPAVQMLRELGVGGEVFNGVMPMGKDDVVGALLGSEMFSWDRSKSTILPGAICEHLTSFGGKLGQRDKQREITHWIRYGAAGTSGTVFEPYATQTKFPTPFIHVHYARGCSLVEAFYQSVMQPYQLLIIGDPLCRPWGTFPRVVLPDLPEGATVKGEITFAPNVAAASPKVAFFELYVDGVLAGAALPGRKMKVDTTKLSDGYHEIRVAGILAGTIRTPGVLIRTFNVANGQAKLTVSPQPGKHPWDKPMKIAASLPGASRIIFYHNARQIGVIEGPEGVVSIDAKLLSQGTVKVYPVGVIDGADGQTRVTAAPVEIEIVPSAPRTAFRGRVKFSGGFVITPEGDKAVVIKWTSRQDMLIQAGIKKGQAFQIGGFFKAPKMGVYQFQIFFDGELEMWVDDEPVALSATRWKFAPMNLAKGLHRFRIEGRRTGSAVLDIRFGGQGTYFIDKQSFWHIQDK